MFSSFPMLLVGDFLQLAPVNGEWIFDPVEPNRAKKILGDSGIRNHFNHFDCFELTEQMRQQGDSSFTELLNDCRLGNVTKKGFQMLESVITSYSIHYTKLYESKIFAMVPSGAKVRR